MKRKKLFGVCFAAILLLGASTFAGADVTVTVEDAMANHGDTGVIVPITVDDATGIAGMDITLTFDSDILTATGARTATLTSGFMIVANPTSGQIRISMAKPTGMPVGSGVVVEVLFYVSADAEIEKNCDLILQDVGIHDESGEEISSTAVNGKFTERY